MPNKLSKTEIQSRLVRLVNLERLHAKDQQTKTKLRAEVRHLKQQLVDQKAYFEAIIESQDARISELETMVFGRKPSGGLTVRDKTNLTKVRIVRNSGSYRRPLPPASAITAEEYHAIANCHRCGHLLTDRDEAIRYEEDVVLAALNPTIHHKTLIKQTIEQGWCSKCGQYSSAKDLRGQIVTLGPVVRSLIVYLIIQADQTYAKAQDLLWQLYRFSVTSGEIANILANRRKTYLPVYEQLKSSVRAGPAHMDETSNPIQSEHGAGYAHVMTSAVNNDTVFCLADSRGKGNSEKLIGRNYQGVGITDRYAGYKRLFLPGRHQICWAHLQRTARDLTHLECLSKTKQKHVTKFYQSLATVYAEIRTIQTEPFKDVKRKTQADDLLKRVTSLCQPSLLDPKKLANLKAGMLEYQDCLFLCLTIDGIPADNNKAERALRKLVIKRKKSFGVKTMKGARTMEVLLSVCYSLYNKDKDNFLPALHGLAVQH